MIKNAAISSNLPVHKMNHTGKNEDQYISKTLFYSSVLLPKVVALYSVNAGKNEDIAKNACL